MVRGSSLLFRKESNKGRTVKKRFVHAESSYDINGTAHSKEVLPRQVATRDCSLLRRELRKTKLI